MGLWRLQHVWVTCQTIGKKRYSCQVHALLLASVTTVCTPLSEVHSRTSLIIAHVTVVAGSIGRVGIALEHQVARHGAVQTVLARAVARRTVPQVALRTDMTSVRATNPAVSQVMRGRMRSPTAPVMWVLPIEHHLSSHALC